MSESGLPGPHPLRLFFALWPSAAKRRSLASAAAAVVSRFRGQPVPAANLHVTLAFLGSVPGRGLAELVRIGGQGGYPAFELVFDRLDYWPKPRVLVATSSATPPEGIEVVKRLWQRIEPLGFRRESRPWRPHLTLARKVPRPGSGEHAVPLDPPPASDDPEPWSLALVESVTHPQGVRYRPLAEWPLGR
ncbi:MAG: RNA 2',3'-cyclic phosphodiesterase [Steroidobacteraceae bacterium]